MEHVLGKVNTYFKQEHAVYDFDKNALPEDFPTSFETERPRDQLISLFCFNCK